MIYPVTKQNAMKKFNANTNINQNCWFIKEL